MRIFYVFSATQLKPDYDWVPQSLVSLLNGILGLSILVCAIAFICGVICFIFCKCTGNPFDDSAGTRILITVFLGAFALSMLSGLMMFGIDHFSSFVTNV